MYPLRYVAFLSAAIAVSACDAFTPSRPSYVIDDMSEFDLAMQDELEIYVGNRILFEADSSDLSPRARDTLQRIALWMADRHDVILLIEGNAADSGTREDDLLLAASRALVALDNLVALGVDESRLKAVSYGREHPAAHEGSISDEYDHRVMLVVFDGW